MFCKSGGKEPNRPFPVVEISKFRQCFGTSSALISPRKIGGVQSSLEPDRDEQLAIGE